MDQQLLKQRIQDAAAAVRDAAGEIGALGALHGQLALFNDLIGMAEKQGNVVVSAWLKGKKARHAELFAGVVDGAKATV